MCQHGAIYWRYLYMMLSHSRYLYNTLKYSKIWNEYSLQLCKFSHVPATIQLSSLSLRPRLCVRFLPAPAEWTLHIGIIHVWFYISSISQGWLIVMQIPFARFLSHQRNATIVVSAKSPSPIPTPTFGNVDSDAALAWPSLDARPALAVGTGCAVRIEAVVTSLGNGPFHPRCDPNYCDLAQYLICLRLLWYSTSTFRPWLASILGT